MSDRIEIGAAYVRVSTDDQTELSPDAQIRIIMDAAKADGYVIPPEFVFVEKKGISGRKADNRPEFQNMISIAKSQSPAPFSRLYLWKFSRFARNQEESIFYKGILRKKCGVEIKSVSEPIMEGMFGRLIETIIEWFDEYYSYNLSGEVKRGMQEKALRHGYQMSPSLGYEAVGGGKPYVINEEKYKIVEYIFQAYHDGIDMTSISRECNRRGWTTRKGKPFERRSICAILRNRFYAGTVEWNGYSFQGSHEIRPSVSSIFEECQERFRCEYHPSKRREVSSCKHWLSGLLRCSTCGSSLAYAKSRNGRSDFFQCYRYMKGVHTGSNFITVQQAVSSIMESMENIIKTGIVEYDYTPKIDMSLETDERILTDALRRVEAKGRRIHEAYEVGVDTLEEYKENKARLDKEKSDLMAEYEQLQARFNSDKPGKEVLIARIRDVYGLLSDPEATYEAKGVAIRSVIKYIVWDRPTKTLDFKYYL